MSEFLKRDNRLTIADCETLLAMMEKVCPEKTMEFTINELKLQVTESLIVAGVEASRQQRKQSVL